MSVDQRVPTADEQRGIDWWDSLPEDLREFWLLMADSALPADAWAVYKQRHPVD